MSSRNCPHCGTETRSYAHLQDHLKTCSVKEEADIRNFREAGSEERQREQDIAYELFSGGFTEEQANTLARVFMERGHIPDYKTTLKVYNWLGKSFVYTAPPAAAINQQLTLGDLNTIRQWHNAIKDAYVNYLEEQDAAVFAKIEAAIAAAQEQSK